LSSASRAVISDEAISFSILVMTAASASAMCGA
jgi:hypothetical protein